MAKTRGRRWGWVAGIALCLSVAPSTGCAYFAAEYARTEALTQELDGYVIPKPLDTVWERATTVRGPYDSLMFSAQGWSWSDTGKYRMRTSTKEDVSNAGSERTVSRTWYEAEGETRGDGCQVRYYKAGVDTTYRGKERVGEPRKYRDRQPGLELELVKMFDAPAGKKIEAKGEAAAQKELND
jgi:hypothetical protein